VARKTLTQSVKIDT